MDFILAYLTFIQLVADFIGKCQNGIDIRDMFALLAKRIKSVQKIGFKLFNSHYVHPLDTRHLPVCSPALHDRQNYLCGRQHTAKIYNMLYAAFVFDLYRACQLIDAVNFDVYNLRW